MKNMRLIPYVCGAGASTAGCELGPQVLKDYGLVEAVRKEGLDIAWHEDPAALYESTVWGKKFHENLPPLGDVERREAIIWHYNHMKEAASYVVESGALPIAIGGDHSIAAGSISGLAQAHNAAQRVGVIWVDAHPDINSYKTSVSQALHGMPIASLLGLIDGDKPVLKPEHIFYLGLRDIDPAEQLFIDDLGISALTADEVNAMGFAAAWQKALDHLQAQTDYLAVSLDLDGFDPSEVKAVGTPVVGGLFRDDVFPVLKGLAHKADLIDIVEYNPTLDENNQTADFVRDLLQVLVAE